MGKMLAMGEQNMKNRSGQVLLSALPFKILYGIKNYLQGYTEFC